LIDVTIHADANGQLIEVHGHSGLAGAGSDILCAAVSVLAENYGETLRSYLKLGVTIKSEAGHYSVFVPAATRSKETELLAGSFLFGIQVLSEQYPERIKLRSL
jgi:uncharacterized protein